MDELWKECLSTKKSTKLEVDDIKNSISSVINEITKENREFKN